MSSDLSGDQNPESLGRELMVKRRYAEAEVMLLKALENREPINLHFVYNHFVEIYYILRDHRPDALDKCIAYCKADIESLPHFIRAYEEAYPGGPPRCPSIERLAIIYEKAGRIQEAIDICKRGIELGLEESFDSYNARYGTNRGYKARIARLEKKLKR